MSLFKLKYMIARILERYGVLDKKIDRFNQRYKNNYIRIVNYHDTQRSQKENFEKQIKWLMDRFEDCNMEKLQSFLDGKYRFSNKPGIIITFDDGYKNNFEIAHRILLKYRATGWYMVSAGLLGMADSSGSNGDYEYMDQNDLVNIIRDGGVIGCHTYSHHRMSADDSEQVLIHEIVDSKRELQEKTGTEVKIFCWCGGEEPTYTAKAAGMIYKAGYQYGFMTNSDIIHPDTDCYQLDRCNLEASWPLSLIKFQISGFMDLKLGTKRRRVHKLTKIERDK